MSTRNSFVAGALAALAVVPAAAAAAPTTLESLSAPTRVAAYAGTAMWSVRDTATGGYRLVKSAGGAAPVAVGVPERAGGPFDVDLGTNRSGSLYAVYTRGGDVWRLRVSTGEETRLASLSNPDAVERDPSIQRGEIAFVREEHGHQYIRVGNTTSGSRGTRVVRRAADVQSVELGINHIAYVVGVPSAAFGEQHVHVRNIATGHDLSVYAAVSGGANAADVTRPSFDSDLSGFVWARTNNASSAGNRIVRYTLHGGRLTYAPGSSRFATGGWGGNPVGFVASTALDAPANSGCEDGGVQYCRVVATGPVAFDRGA